MTDTAPAPTAREQAAAAPQVVPVTGSIGAEIRGIELSGNLSEEAVALIRQALLDHKVVFFRDQHHLDDAAQEAFSARFGALQKHPMARAAGSSEALLDLEESEAYAASIWHTDMTFMPDPAAFAILRAIELPEVGGDTMWANAANGYQRLPEPLRLFADSLWAIHSSDFDFDGSFDEDYKARMKQYGAGPARAVLRTEHPVVQVHPESGERSLILGSWFDRFVGLRKADSTKIFEILQSYVTDPANTVRWQWRSGDVAMWDNRATQHRSVPDHGTAARKLRRSTVLGTVPTGVDGRQSRRLEA